MSVRVPAYYPHIKEYLLILINFSRLRKLNFIIHKSKIIDFVELKNKYLKSSL
jgi:hypothetical protein